MITDALLQLASVQAVTSTAVSTNTIDLSTLGDVGRGQRVQVAITVDTTVTAAGAATVNFQLITSAASALTSPNVIAQTDAIGKADLTAGRRPIYLQISPQVLSALPSGQRYLGLQFAVGTGPLTAGAFTASIVDTAQTGAGINYPTNRTIF